MSTNPPQKYTKQRKKVVPPHVPIKGLRVAAGLSMDQLIAKLAVVSDRTYTRGAISAVELGHRGASPELLSALERVYGLDPGMISTTYEPKTSGRREVAA
jgi:transcriptional regulator with XRE-family HTH domain